MGDLAAGERVELIGPFRQPRLILAAVRLPPRSAEEEWRVDAMTRLYGSGITMTEIGSASASPVSA